MLTEFWLVNFLVRLAVFDHMPNTQFCRILASSHDMYLNSTMDPLSPIPQIFRTRKATTTYLKANNIITCGDLAKVSDPDFNALIQNASHRLRPWLHMTRKEVIDKLTDPVYAILVKENSDINDAQEGIAKCVELLGDDFANILDDILVKYRGLQLSDSIIQIIKVDFSESINHKEEFEVNTKFCGK
jgi:hypothetical protein